MAFAHKIPDREESGRLRRIFPGFTDGFVRSQPLNLFMPLTFKRDCLSFSNFEIRSDDTWIISFPKSGTTWTQEMVWLIANDCDFQGAQTLLRERVPFLEDRSLWPDECWSRFHEKLKTTDEPVCDISFQPDFIATLPSPRFIKTHLPFSYLPGDLIDVCKVVYVARNPKDVVVSWFYHHKLDPIMETTADFKQFVQLFIKDEVIYAPYWATVLEAWSKRTQPNFLFLFYEDLKLDLPGQIRRVAKFLGKTLTDDQVSALTHHLSFDQFKNNPWVNAQELQATGYFSKNGSFIRKGQIGDWKNHFDEELTKQFDTWVEQNLKGTDFKFPKSK